MALFNKDSKEEKKTDAVAKKEVKKTDTKAEAQDFSWVLKAPKVTEKSAFISSGNAYTFDVAADANKIQIKQAIKEAYKVTPLKVNVINRKAHKATKRGRKIHVSAKKKAIVFLKKGDTIELV
jgi:large subunit ribosomal protein L23